MLSVLRDLGGETEEKAETKKPDIQRHWTSGLITHFIEAVQDNIEILTDLNLCCKWAKQPLSTENNMKNKRLQMTPEFKVLIKAFQIIDHQRDRQRQKDPEFKALRQLEVQLYNQLEVQ